MTVLKRIQQGVTLIELLVVIVMLGIAIALVGPLTISQVDKFKAKNEELLLKRWVKQASYYAFKVEKSKSYYLDGKAIYEANTLNPESPKSENVDVDKKVVLQFNELFFLPMTLNFNPNGYASLKLLTYTVRGQSNTLNIDELLTGRHEK